MEVLRFEIWRDGTKLEETQYEAPLTRDEALRALREENPVWRGKLLVKDSQLGLRGPRKLDPSKIYVLQLADLAGRSLCMIQSSMCVFSPQHQVDTVALHYVCTL